MNFDKLFFLRESMNLSQSQMGRIVGTHKTSICNWEKGKEIIPLKKLNIYANYFNVSMDYILNLTDEKNNASNLEELNKTIIGNNIKIIRENNNLSYNDLAKVLNTSKSTIWAYEKGKTLILTAFAYQICKEYNVSLDWLCGRIR